MKNFIFCAYFVVPLISWRLICQISLTNVKLYLLYVDLEVNEKLSY